jgi:hypothetical protein
VLLILGRPWLPIWLLTAWLLPWLLLAVIPWVRQCVFPQNPKGTYCLRMADVPRTLLEYRRARLMPGCFRCVTENPFQEGNDASPAVTGSGAGAASRK